MYLKKYGKGHEYDEDLDSMPTKYWIGVFGLTGLTYLTLILLFTI